MTVVIYLQKLHLKLSRLNLWILSSFLFSTFIILCWGAGGGEFFQLTLATDVELQGILENCKNVVICALMSVKEIFE